MPIGNQGNSGVGQGKNPDKGVDIAGLNASANGVLNAIEGMGAIAARIEAGIKTLQIERDKAVKTVRTEGDKAAKTVQTEGGKAVDSIHKERDSAIAAVQAARPSSPSNNLDRPLVPSNNEPTSGPH